MTFDDPDHPMDEYYAKAKEARALIEQMRDNLRAFADVECDYMKINNLGDGEKQHNVKWARKNLTAADEWLKVNK